MFGIPLGVSRILILALPLERLSPLAAFAISLTTVAALLVPLPLFSEQKRLPACRSRGFPQVLQMVGPDSGGALWDVVLARPVDSMP